VKARCSLVAVYEKHRELRNGVGVISMAKIAALEGAEGSAASLCSSPKPRLARLEETGRHLNSRLP